MNKEETLKDVSRELGKVYSTQAYMENKRKEIKNDLINKVDRMQLVDLILVQNAVDILIARDKMKISKR
jgi:hypothetical protein